MSGRLLFLKQFWSQYHTTGAIWPSGSSLANELAYFVEHGSAAANESRRILEVGPGTGTVTHAIIQRLRPLDQLTLVEINPDFSAHLARRLEQEASWQAKAQQVTIHTGPIQDFAVEQPFDLIVSGLPLNNFSVEIVSTILSGFERLVKAGGTVSFFEYIAIRHFKAVVSSSAEKTRLRGIAELLDQFLKNRECRKHAVWLNMPPAWAHHLKK
jgi:phosphatidylethanolamine/phosphatidyl-N-methylethanolamine N-methyltransferase